jgi:hypothetical protein
MFLFLKAIAIGGLAASLSLPNFDDAIPTSATRVKIDFARSCHVEAHEFILEKTTLANIVHALGEGVIWGNHEDAAGCETFIDYTDGTNLIRFSSNCEMGGGDLDEVRIIPRLPKDLTGLPRLKGIITFSFGTCGMSYTELQSRLGSTIKVKGTVTYLYEGRKPIRISTGKLVDYDVTGCLSATISHGKVIAVDVTHTTSS